MSGQNVLDPSLPVFYENPHRVCWNLEGSGGSYRNLRKTICNVDFGLRQVAKEPDFEDVMVLAKGNKLSAALVAVDVKVILTPPCIFHS